MFFGASSSSAVKLILGFPWDLEILDGMLWQLGVMCKLTTLYLPNRVHFDQYDHNQTKDLKTLQSSTIHLGIVARSFTR